MREPDPHKQTMNLQVFADVRQVAALDRFIWQQELASPRTLSQLGRVCIEMLYTVVRDNFSNLEEFTTIEEAIAWLERRNFSMQQFASSRHQGRLTKALIVQNLQLDSLVDDRPTNIWEQWKATYPEEAKLLNAQANQMAKDLVTVQGLDHAAAITAVQTWLETRKVALMGMETTETFAEHQDFDFEKLAQSVVDD